MNIYLKVFAVSTGLVLGVTGCSQKNDLSDQLLQKDMEIQRLSQQVRTKEEKISFLETSMNKYDVKETKVDKIDDSTSLVPPNAKPGECYAKVLVPAKYQNKPVSRLVKEAQSRIEVVPATYKTVEKRLVVKEASTRLISVPATYKTVRERIMVVPEKTRLVTVPATYKTVSEKVLISPAHTAWKKGRGEIEKINNSTGDIMCLVEIPAVYRTVTKKVLDRDSYTKEVRSPAVYKTITKRVLVNPATTKEIKIPAVYRVVKTKVVDTPAQERKVNIPAVYETYNTKVKISEPYLKWEEILCETNTTPNVIAKLQRALQEKEYDVTKIDGIYGAETKAAVLKYQKDKGLNRGALTLETLKSLGL